MFNKIRSKACGLFQPTAGATSPGYFSPLLRSGGACAPCAGIIFVALFLFNCIIII